MERYVDGFVLPVPDEKVDTYRDMAAEVGKLWIEYGALEYFEGVGDDMKPDMDGMSIRTFPQIAETDNDETVVFSFIVFESREHRDTVNEKVMADIEMESQEAAKEMPFEMERMAYGGFRSIVSMDAND
ncbi:DUF1428 domain-containing protein [Halocatena halophila]|uniref:DUF1428 domain-containing protein n=1 Tax=Halocatena halophila TaxID=2814576 RepID=UPI002ED42F36